MGKETRIACLNAPTIAYRGTDDSDMLKFLTARTMVHFQIAIRHNSICKVPVRDARIVDSSGIRVLTPRLTQPNIMDNKVLYLVARAGWIPVMQCFKTWYFELDVCGVGYVEVGSR